jgi:hypothetical protein
MGGDGQALGVHLPVTLAVPVSSLAASTTTGPARARAPSGSRSPMTTHPETERATESAPSAGETMTGPAGRACGSLALPISLTPSVVIPSSV